MRVHLAFVCGSGSLVVATLIWRVLSSCVVVLTAVTGMVSIRSKGGLDGRFSEDAELSFKKFVEVMSELFTRSDIDDVMGRQGGHDGASW